MLADNRVDEATAIVKRLVFENEKLARDLANLRQRLRKKGEGISAAQLQLLLAQLEATQSAGGLQASETEVDAAVLTACEQDAQREDQTRPPAPPTPVGKPTRREPPEKLERRDNPLLVPEDERRCTKCGCAMNFIEFEPHEVIDFQPAQVFVRVDLREKRGCSGCRETVVRAPLGDKVIAGGAYGSALVTEFIVKKFRDGLSLHRIREEMQRLGIDIPSSTIS
ncbi:MAG: hypothetical protein FJ144_28500, partial [Deltaproteobacteria bacterium]|nr:hypothetical protein [Deltaproteobacteria bacterium]